MPQHCVEECRMPTRVVVEVEGQDGLGHTSWCGEELVRALERFEITRGGSGRSVGRNCLVGHLIQHDGVPLDITLSRRSQP